MAKKLQFTDDQKAAVASGLDALINGMESENKDALADWKDKIIEAKKKGASFKRIAEVICASGQKVSERTISESYNRWVRKPGRPGGRKSVAGQSAPAAAG